MKRKALILLAFFTFSTLAARANVDVYTDGIKPGVWTVDFSEAKEYAERHHAPLVFMWSRSASSCGNCSKAHRAVGLDIFKSWMDERQYVFVFEQGTSYSPTYSYAEGDGRAEMPYFPCWRVYWKKRDGSVVDVNFSGVAGYIPGTSSKSDLKNAALANAYMNAVDNLVGTYVPNQLPEVTFDVVDGQELEIEIGEDARTLIGLNRVDTCVATNLLIMADVTNEVVWAKDETRREIVYELPIGAKVNDKIDLGLLDGEFPEEGLIAEASLRVVAPQSNSVTNPCWLGECSMDTLKWGEWTMDLDVATQKVAAAVGNAYTLALVSGSLWCPWCIGLEQGLLSTTEFVEWAENNQVALVNIDNPKRDDSPPTLLRYALGANGKSGASYLSRKGITQADAEAVILRNHELGYATWLAPESSRVGYPTVILLNKRGEVAGRLNYCADANKVFDTAENMARLDDLLKLAEVGNERNSYASTTELEIGSDGANKKVALQINENTKVYRVTNILASSTVAFSVDAPVGKQVTLKLFSTDSSLSDGTLLASGVGAVSNRFESAAENIYLSVSSYDSTSQLYGQNTAFDVQITSKTTLHHGLISFVTDASRAWDRAENTMLQVSRTDGSAGAASVKVHLSDASTLSVGRLDWEDVILTWSDGEAGIKNVPIDFNVDQVYADDETATFELVAQPISSADIGEISMHALTVYSINAPTALISDMTLNTLFATDLSYPVKCVENPTSVKLKIVSGKLPSGVKIAYDKKTGCVVITGTPTKEAVSSVTFVLTERRGKETIAGPETTVVFGVRKSSNVNPYTGRAISCVLPMMVDGVIAGVLNVSITAKNKIKAKFQGTAKKALTFSGAWQSLSEDGTASAELSLRTGEQLTLALNADGTGTAELMGVDNLFGDTLSAPLACGWVNNEDLTSYAGYYTVSLPINEEESAVGVACAKGATSLILKLDSSSFVRKGTFAFSGMLPSGQTIKGSSAIMLSKDGMAYLPIFYKSSKDCMGTLLKLEPNAKINYKTAPMVITGVNEIGGFWNHTETGYSFTAYLDAYGAYYNTADNFADYCEDVYFTTEMEATLQSEGFVGGNRYGLPQDASAVAVSIVDNKMLIASNPWLKLSFNRKTGVVSGTAAVNFQNGGSVKAKVWGVVLPGWHDCGCTAESVIDRPLVSAAAYWSDKVNGKTAKLGVGIELTPIKEDE